VRDGPGKDGVAVVGATGGHRLVRKLRAHLLGRRPTLPDSTG
jgi:hypothetical protein